MDHVEVGGALEDRPDRGVEPRRRIAPEPVRPQRAGDGRDEVPRHRGIGAGEGRDIVAAREQLVDEGCDDPFGAAIAPRGDGLHGRRDLGNSEATGHGWSALRRLEGLFRPR